ncbi:MAG: hypothetical protein OQL16_02895 [Gammaproteobacteria bacterium]|nr:hypothetical protein [Gammaproteobacteria bacterium]
MSFARLHPLLNVFVQMMLFRQRPDILPASVFLFAVLLVMNLIIGVGSFLIDFDLLQSLLRTVVDMAFSLAFIYLLLLAANKINRSLQTMIAMLGVSAILNVLSFPLLLLLPEVRTTIGPVGFILYGLFFWHIAIMGHIFRHAISVNLPTGLLIAFSYVLIAISVFYSLFPVQ